MNRREFLVGAVTLPVALRFSTNALAGGTPVALVTADTQSRVAVVELSTGKILRSIPTAAGPRSIESVWGKLAVVCHTTHGIVSLIDGPSGGPRRRRRAGTACLDRSQLQDPLGLAGLQGRGGCCRRCVPTAGAPSRAALPAAVPRARRRHGAGWTSRLGQL